MEIKLTEKELEKVLNSVKTNQYGGVCISKEENQEVSVWGSPEFTYSKWVKDYLLKLGSQGKNKEYYYLGSPRINLTEYIKERTAAGLLVVDNDTLEVTDMFALNEKGLKLAGLNSGTFGNLLQTQYIYRNWTIEDLFGDEIMFCPVCGKSKFINLQPAGGIYCDECNAKFNIRHTAGDPGVVVDCIVKDVYGYFLPEGKHSFWLILKNCEGGLDDREKWCYSGNANYNYGYRREDVIGQKQYRCEVCHKNYRESEMAHINYDDYYVIHHGLCKTCKETQGKSVAS